MATVIAAAGALLISSVTGLSVSGKRTLLRKPGQSGSPVCAIEATLAPS